MNSNKLMSDKLFEMFTAELAAITVNEEWQFTSLMHYLADKSDFIWDSGNELIDAPELTEAVKDDVVIVCSGGTLGLVAATPGKKFAYMVYEYRFLSSPADQLLYNAGWIQETEFPDWIGYGPYLVYSLGEEWCLRFDLLNKSVYCSQSDDVTLIYSAEDIKAIYEKTVELGW